MSKLNDKIQSHGCGSQPINKNMPNTATPLELHACMGLNACRGHDRFGTNTCAGTGYCATETHVCHTLNNCAGQGGCGLFGDAAEQCKPGANDCSWQGSCATPIQAERFSTLGANKNNSVWLLARELFQQRMDKSRRNVGQAPFPAGPPQAWLESFGEYDSCGNSGDKSCSFGFNNPAQNTQELVERSIESRSKTLAESECSDTNNKLNDD
ncbi:hypothetical protein CXF83_20380 [Shewanella sp. Choline-02u-19]|jgi:hypothetical protein|uniref:hypothetical protein n=1 Tax=unclassified Shewanella TaxID=196818 RepID=UPI000C3362F1|nr:MULTISPECIES: hypothetical protein [unclassified Shewanella]PKG74472.1 hypothetical protein CXF86_11905 [Shewanella sp. GutCb]PKH53857.1 hypothetical protein CXF84_21540 [Shewanella sp. Bg11-22]PKI28891.1 hypothetical protein CXF83_20380 [Shewanella sp. Choline-02u-19]